MRRKYIPLTYLAQNPVKVNFSVIEKLTSSFELIILLLESKWLSSGNCNLLTCSHTQFFFILRRKLMFSEHSNDEKACLQQNIEYLLEENKFLRRKIEKLQQDNSEVPVLVGSCSAAVVGFVFMFSANSVKTYLTTDFITAFFTWFSMIMSSILVFTPSYMFFNMVFNKIDKISQSGTYFSPNRSTFRAWIPTIVFVAMLIILAFISSL